jgi:ubiquinone/menaquinone biosynthesis C-methylase UbiE
MTSSDDPVLTTKAAYEGHAAAWAERDHNYEQRSRNQEQFLTLLPSGGRVLDLGCGPGIDSTGLAARGLHVTGLDITRAMLKIAAEQVSGRLVQGDARRLPFQDAAFEGVWASASLLHLPKAQVGEALRELRRVMRPGGAFYSGMKKGSADELMVSRPEVVRDARHFSHYQPEEWSRLLANAGFGVKLQSVENQEATPPDTPWIITYAIAV